MFTKYSFFDSYEEISKSIDIHFQSNVLQLGLSVKYEYPKGKWRPTLAAGASFISLPGEFEEITKTYYHENGSDQVRTSTQKFDLQNKFLGGFSVTPGIHYYLSKKRIISVQLQYLRCSKKVFESYPANVVQSFGLSAGIYF